MVIWSSEMAERLAMGDWLREHLSYEDKLGFYADLSEGIRGIVESAFDLATPAPRADSAERTADEGSPLDAPPATPLATGEAENPNQQTRLSASGARHHGGR